MLGNNQFGDCGPAATEHYRDAKAGEVIAAITADMTLKLYFGYGVAQGEPGPQPDQGVDNATWLNYLFTHDADGNAVAPGQGLVEAFAELDLDSDTVHQAMNNFNGVLIGCVLTDDAEREFEEGKPWTVTSAEGLDPKDGHDVLLVKYDTASRSANETVVTWGQLQDVTISWERAEVKGPDLEAWVIITAEDAQRNGVDLAALQAAIVAWGGTVAPGSGQ